jgi:hypothetical protein
VIFILSSPEPNVCQCGTAAAWHVATGNGFVMQLCDKDVSRLLSLWRGRSLEEAAREFQRTTVVRDQ